MTRPPRGLQAIANRTLFVADTTLPEESAANVSFALGVSTWAPDCCKNAVREHAEEAFNDECNLWISDYICSEYGGVRQRWLIVNQARKDADLKRIWKKHLTKHIKKPNPN